MTAMQKIPTELLDNLLKGAASQAVENFNRLIDEPVGLGLLPGTTIGITIANVSGPTSGNSCPPSSSGFRRCRSGR